MRHGFPVARPGESIGLLGGSFDPAHEGHVHITCEALKRFNLSRVWWLVSPGNPLKPHGPAALTRRLERARKLMKHPRVAVTDLEAHLGTRVTADTLRALRAIYPGVVFTWLMGADNLAQFHHWRNWREILNNHPVGVLARPQARLQACTSPAARISYASARLSASASRLLPRTTAPAWCYVSVPLVAHSSSQIRAAGRWG